MPYASNDALPPRIREHLPPHAQDIFRKAFNNAGSHMAMATLHDRKRWLTASLGRREEALP